jgi:hypothetical protein
MDDRKHEPGRRGRCEQSRGVGANSRKREGERRRHEQLPRRGRGKGENRVGAARAGRETHDRHLSPRNRAGSPGAAEQCPSRLVGNDDRERSEDRREVKDDQLGVRSRDPGDQREKAVPERERVSRVEAGVGKLADSLERELVELEKLSRPAEMEETVALHRPSYSPEQDPECGTGSRRHPTSGNPVLCTRPPNDIHAGRGDRSHHEQPECQRQRRLQQKRCRKCDEHEGERPGECRRDAAHAERARKHEAGSKHEPRREDEPEVELDVAHGPGSGS